MAKKFKATKSVSQKKNSDRTIQGYLIAVPIVAFLFKMIVMANTPHGGWYGADGENYMAGVNGLLKDGFFSEEGKLSYWPAGYPILIWPLAKISLVNVYYFLSFVQSLFFAYSTYFFTKNLRVSKFAYLAVLTSFLISFNPTLSLNSLSVGYETPIAACLMMAVGTIMRSYNSAEFSFYIKPTCSTAAWFALAIFMQPRFILVGLVLMILWAFKFDSKKSAGLLILIGVAVMATTPAIMIYRNINVIDQATISTNLSVAVSYGAGDETEGGYNRTGPEIPCTPIPPATSVTDNQKVACVLKWYLTNPTKTARLAYNKTQFFWSPWSGPLVNGTMARNPWLKIAPAQNISKSKDGHKLVYGPMGKLISYIWVAGQIFLLFIGYRELRRLGSTEKFYANLMLLPVILSWLISIGTIGDHRFRIPTMTLSLLLQGAGLVAIKNRLPKVS